MRLSTVSRHMIREVLGLPNDVDEFVSSWNQIWRSAPMVLWAARWHVVPLRLGCPEFESWLMDLSWSHASLSPTSLPVDPYYPI